MHHRSVCRFKHSSGIGTPFDAELSNDTFLGYKLQDLMKVHSDYVHFKTLPCEKL